MQFLTSHQVMLSQPMSSSCLLGQLFKNLKFFHMVSDDMEYPFGQFWSSVLVLFPPQPPLTNRKVEEFETPLVLCSSDSETTKTSEYHQHCLYPESEHSIILHTMKKNINSVHAETKTFNNCGTLPESHLFFSSALSLCHSCLLPSLINPLNHNVRWVL